MERFDVNKLEQEISLLRLAEAAGIGLVNDGDIYRGLCPFHADTVNSFSINLATNRWCCEGDCNRDGSVIDWIMQKKKLSYDKAVDYLQHELAGLLVKAPTQASNKRQSMPFATDLTDQALLNQVASFYHASLKDNPKALAFLERFGLGQSDCIEHFKIGFSDRQLGLRLPEKNRKAGAAIRHQLQQIGILRDSGHEHFRGSITIPMFDTHQDVQQMYGRKINNNLRKGTQYHSYLPGELTPLFNPAIFTASDTIILCGEILDALTFWCAGQRHVTANYGQSDLNPAILTACQEHTVLRVILAHRNAPQGNEAAQKAADAFLAAGMECYRLHCPTNLGPNDVARQHPDDIPAQLCRLLDGATRIVSPTTRPHAESFESNSINTLPSNELGIKMEDDAITLSIDDRFYRIKGFLTRLTPTALKVNLLIHRGDAVYVDTLDLYAARQRTTYTKGASAELGISEALLNHDLGRILLKLESLQTESLETVPPDPLDLMSDGEMQAALAYLKSPDLFAHILSDFKQCQIVGEEANLLTGYLAAVSRKLVAPLAVIIQSSSASGKTALMDAVLAMIPEEDKLEYSAMTSQSLYYMERHDIRHKILAISEEEGARQAVYALKLLQSEHQISMASTGKDMESGKHKTYSYHVEGPVMLIFTTTSIDIDEELLNRCLVLAVDDSRSQTQAIHQLQRQKRTLQGLTRWHQRDAILDLHHNVQRLIRPFAVVNPYAEQLTFQDNLTRTRRDHDKYLTLIDSIALLHQYQRPILTTEDSTEYIEVTLSDIAKANHLAHQILGRTLDDLPPQTRRLLDYLVEMVNDKTQTEASARCSIRFTKKDVRDFTGWGNTQVSVHLKRLRELEYLLRVGGGRSQQYQYELLYSGQGTDGQPFLMELIEVEQITSQAEHSGSNRGGFGANSGLVQCVKTVDNMNQFNTLDASKENTPADVVFSGLASINRNTTSNVNSDQDA